MNIHDFQRSVIATVPIHLHKQTQLVLLCLQLHHAVDTVCLRIDSANLVNVARFQVLIGWRLGLVPREYRALPHDFVSARMQSHGVTALRPAAVEITAPVIEAVTQNKAVDLMTMQHSLNAMSRVIANTATAYGMNLNELLIQQTVNTETVVCKIDYTAE